MLGKQLADCKVRVGEVKSRLVSTQDTLSQHSTLVSHITDQQKQCEARLSLVKISDLEVRRTKRDHHDLQVCTTSISLFYRFASYIVVVSFSRHETYAHTCNARSLPYPRHMIYYW